MHRTLVIRREYLHYVPKYARYEKRHKNLAAHVSPAFRVEEGDQVTVGQCRPLSKTASIVNSLRTSSQLSVLIGPIQRPTGSSTNRESNQGVPEILNGDTSWRYEDSISFMCSLA